MSRLFMKLTQIDRKLFQYINGCLHNRFFNFFFYYLTYLGGATFTIASSVLIWYFGSSTWSKSGALAAVSLAVSHIPVAAAKKLYPRLRPYLALPGTRTFRNPLKDHSFPSGHTTAAFSLAIPLILGHPEWICLFLPLSLLVGVSRIYLGLHYPSDVFAGAVIGTSVAAATVALWP
ncbi:phosphatase PAP2 family protein [Paenibacillus sp. KQZ6P-2]|uniref:Phosphatase PAP2 family protein n=1 Tax=Paenibacillus mangrovi TaxID=2931978 RepID=A0A9X1WTG9_9BACL|nr:phosphatase PAP2 family protein [Paenibacillus mangrovi]MCJ8013295.1 phosphatase PAP2 family protein [Paenibacillus mangrovi]